MSFGIFPASHIHIREQLEEGDARIGELAAHADKVERDSRKPRSRGPSRNGLNGRMEPLHEEDEEDEEEKDEEPASASQQIQINIVPYGSPTKSKNRASIGSVTSIGTAFSPSRPPSEILETRPNPPLPNLKCGDETTHGARETLIDEIACALREWASLMANHLHRRDYALFSSVKERFDFLHSGRRRLLSKQLDSAEEETLKEGLVDCLARGNIEQGLDIIVRHPQTGTVVDAEIEGLAASPSWLSIVRLCELYLLVCLFS